MTLLNAACQLQALHVGACAQEVLHAEMRGLKPDAYIHPLTCLLTVGRRAVEFP